jgi:RNase P/RNase MRP subunit POP5
MKNTRHRYIAFEISKTPEVCPARSSVIEAIISRLRVTKNQPSGFRFRLVDYDSTGLKGIVKTIPHTAVEWMKNLISSINEIYSKRATISILGTSGTLKALRSKYFATNRSTKNNNSGQSNISTERDEPAVPL